MNINLSDENIVKKARSSILVADDSKANLLNLSDILGEEYTIITASNGQECIELAEKFLPDLILLDIAMPEMDGYKILAQLKNTKKTKDIPVIFITELSSSEDEEKGLALGVADYITKPFSPGILKLRVKNQIKILKQDEQRKLTDEIYYHDILTSAVNAATAFMLSLDIGTFEEKLYCAMEAIGHAAKVDRTYIWKNHIKDGELCCTQIFEWSEGAEPQQGNELTLSISYKKNAPYWGEVLSQNKAVNSFVRSLPKEEKEHLEAQNVLSILAVPIFMGGHFWGFFGFDDCHNERIFTEKEEETLRSSALLFATAWIHNETQKNIYHRDKMLHAVNDMSSLLLNSDIDSFEKYLQIGIEKVAEAVKVDCIYLWKNHIIDGKLFCSQVFEWSLEKTMLTDGKLYSYSEVVPDWEGILSNRRYINSIVRDMSQKEQDHLTPHGVLSILVVPIFREEQFWGFVGYDNCHKEHIFTKEEVSVLQSGSMIIANSFIRNEMFVNLRETSIQLESALNEANAANKSKTSFLALVSHEIRTPMNAIIGMTQIELQKELPAEYASVLEKINDFGNILLRIINDILDLTKIETGKMELNHAEYYIPSVINDAVQLNIVRLASKPIEFKLDINENTPLKFIGDNLRIKQILNNLLSNAIKYTDGGYVKLSVKHSLQNGDIFLHLSVEDTGQGITPEDQKKLFTAYSRFDKNMSAEGTGLGLNITKKLVEIMDGSIEFKSEYGRGSTFTVKIKQKAAGSKVIGAELSESLRGFTYSSKKLNKKQIIRELMPYGKVLIVDDVESNLYVAEGLLSFYKLKVETATSGYAVIDKVKKGVIYDIIFMDHMMPEMDGMETAQKLRAMGYNGTIVALTANAITGSKELFLQNGFDDFIPKPIDIKYLNVILNKYVRDKYPEEAAKYKATIGNTTQAQSASITPKLLEVFCRDAEKAVITLREAAASGDIKLFTTTVHAMKSALANIGEDEKSVLALALEEAGRNNNKAFIDENTKSFAEMLENMIGNLRSQDAADDACAEEDTAFLKEHLLKIKAACENYDDAAAYASLDLLKEKLWKKETLAALNKIRDLLFLDSDFEAAAKQVKIMLK